MKRRILIPLALCLLLCGCAAPAQTADCFVVSDALPPDGGAPGFHISLALPTDALCTAAAEDGRSALYEAADGSYRIQTCIYPQTAPETALALETGFAPDALRPIRSQLLGMTEYRYGWTSSSEDGQLLCSGALLYDGQDCYCLQFGAVEASARQLSSLGRQVLESFSLSEGAGY